MKRIISVIAVWIGVAASGNAQQRIRDSLYHELTLSENKIEQALIMLSLSDYYAFGRNDSASYFIHLVLRESPDDSIRIQAYSRLCALFRYTRPDSTLYYANLGLILSREHGFIKDEVSIMNSVALTEKAIGNFSKALQLNLHALKLAEKHELAWEKAFAQSMLAQIYFQTGDNDKSISNYKKALKHYLLINEIWFTGATQGLIGEAFAELGQTDSARHYCEEALKTLPVPNYFLADILGNTYKKLGDVDQSLRWYRSSIQSEELYLRFKGNLAIAKIYQALNKADSALYYGLKALDVAHESGFFSNSIEANSFLSDFYKERSPSQSLLYARQEILYQDSLTAMERSMTMENFISVDEEQRHAEIEASKKEFRYRLRMNALLGSSFTLLVVAFVLYISRRQSKKAKKDIEVAYIQLKATQSQLIQSEKMASLGELTAGIAHEIQNPLNFVNNFSELNSELVSELESAAETGNITEIKNLVKDIKENEGKINHHGKRADSIVKGMLQHSRASSGQKELTDINVLCDEYLRLAYHGFRAKDKSFLTRIETDFEPSLPKLNVVPQDIGRAVLNLINNAFYAVGEKQRMNLNGYEPTVSVSTKRLSNKVEISIKDNGTGIPEGLKEKIFQPFFTTKPTGQGTGLGLSLSYDIVKAHGGELTVETSTGDGSAFNLYLPIAQ